jgi:amino acid transporter
MSLRSAIFMGVGAMVGAGIFALMGESAAIAGNATWLSFLIAGVVALLSGYSFAMLGARYPSNGGQIEFLIQEFGSGITSGALSILFIFAGISVLAMGAQTFGSYTSNLFFGENADAIWVNIFATLIIVGLTLLNFVGSDAVNKAQAAAVVIVVGILTIFVVAALTELQSDLLATSKWPETSDILASVAVTFFAFTGFGVLTNASGQMKNPERELKQAISISLLFTIVLYVAVSIAVFGNLSVQDIISDQNTAIAAVAESVMGNIGGVMIGIAAMFATAETVNANLYGQMGGTWDLAEKGVIPSQFGDRLWKSGTYGLAAVAILALLMANFLNLTAIASLGSTLVLLVWVMTNLGHFRLLSQTKANPIILGLATLGALAALVLFLVYTWGQTPGIVVAFFVITIAAFILEAILRAVGHKQEMQAAHVSEKAAGS